MKKDSAMSYYIKYFIKIKLITTIINIVFKKTLKVQFYFQASPLKEQPPEENGVEMGLFKTQKIHYLIGGDDVF